MPCVPCLWLWCGLMIVWRGLYLITIIIGHTNIKLTAPRLGSVVGLCFSGKISGCVSSYRDPIFMVKRKLSFKPFISPPALHKSFWTPLIKIKVSRKNIHFPYSCLTFWVKKNGSILSIFPISLMIAAASMISVFSCHKNILLIGQCWDEKLLRRCSPT